EDLLEGLFQGDIDLGHGDGQTQGCKTGHAELLVAYATRHDAREMVKVRIDVQAHTVEAHPMAQPHANGRDFVFAAVTMRDPNTDTAVSPLAFDVELRQRADQPLLEVAHELPYV